MKKYVIKQLQREVVAEAKRLSAERKELTDKMTAIDLRLAELRRSLDGLRAVLGEIRVPQLPSAEAAILAPIDPGQSITTGIRQLFVHNRVLTGPSIREAFKKAGFQKDDYTLLITIHNNLKRLAHRGEIKAIRLGRRKVAYERVNPLERVVGEDEPATTPQTQPCQ
jgi:hypothetical protein